MFRITKEVNVDELSDLKVVGGDILDYLGEELGDVSALGDQLYARVEVSISVSSRAKGKRTAMSLFIASSFSLSLLESSCFPMFLTFSSVLSR